MIHVVHNFLWYVPTMYHPPRNVCNPAPYWLAIQIPGITINCWRCVVDDFGNLIPVELVS